ncbi:single-stranded DNA-binding protein [Paraburkholderia saeva]|uniref:single-stranded DNA-binding protein n=1 Tax=Paraburkholderia saeva TaxID=2777537 RepID=UPI001D5B2625|nr:single-stranded DNA-binding protein [Paraburkholderia saeva]CAG4924643.1 hypothetical protein R52603_05286 [Paraburkholderia saeva]
MIDGLVSGSLVRLPQEKTGASGRSFTQCRLRVPVTDGESLFVLAIAFDDDVRRSLCALTAGDSVSIAGPMRIGTWTPPQGGEPRVNV